MTKERCKRLDVVAQLSRLSRWGCEAPKRCGARKRKSSPDFSNRSKGKFRDLLEWMKISSSVQGRAKRLPGRCNRFNGGVEH